MSISASSTGRSSRPPARTQPLPPPHLDLHAQPHRIAGLPRPLRRGLRGRPRNSGPATPPRHAHRTESGPGPPATPTGRKPSRAGPRNSLHHDKAKGAKVEDCKRAGANRDYGPPASPAHAGSVLPCRRTCTTAGYPTGDRYLPLAAGFTRHAPTPRLFHRRQILCKTLDLSFQSLSQESTTHHSSQGGELGERIDPV